MSAGPRRPFHWPSRHRRVPISRIDAERQEHFWTEVDRVAQVVLGLVCVGVAVIVLASPQLSITGLLILLAIAVGLVSGQVLLANAIVGVEKKWYRGPGLWWKAAQSLGVIGIALVAIALALFAIFDPSLAVTTGVFVLAIALVSQALGRMLRYGGVTLPEWNRRSSLSIGLFTVALVIVCVAFEGFSLPSFAILVGIILIVSGIDTVVAGIRPTDPRQFILLKLILFSALYGLILINWIDLFGKSAPGYGLWLILTYMAPFAVLLIFEGLDAWPLAISLGLLVSLFNDVGYFFIGNLIFGFHENLVYWIEGQLGFQGSQIVTVFQGGSFSIQVTSWMMGLSIYVRAAVVSAILYYWWKHPGNIVARSAPPPAISATWTIAANRDGSPVAPK